MKSVWLQDDGLPQTLVFFAGWSMDERPFRRLTSAHYDVCICYDYRDLSTVLTADSVVGRYDGHSSDRLLERSGAAWARVEQVTVVAWSFGCAVAAQFMARLNWPLHRALAINGTVTPEDDQCGIPTSLLDMTSEHLSSGGWPKFVRRMCLDQAGRRDFEQHAPLRDLAGAAVELNVLRRLKTPAACGFTQAIVGSRDRIILPENQQRGWNRFHVPVHTIAAPHYPFHLWNTWEELIESVWPDGVS